MLTSSRLITESDIQKCAELTGDRGAHHIAGLEGTPIAQGCSPPSTAPLIKNDHGFRFTSMSLTFLAPVYAGDTVTADVWSWSWSPRRTARRWPGSLS